MRGTYVFLSLVSLVSAKPPNILYILLDDFGWADAGWHRPSNDTEVVTPNMNALVREGVELDRHYAFKYCSPTRSAIQSGRNPIHVNVLNIPDAIHNPKDPVSGYTEIPRNMTGIAEHLRDAGYETHMYGKWHAGVATPQHTPLGRGYQNSLHYFSGANDYWTSYAGKCWKGVWPVDMVDLWDTDKPAYGQNNPGSCSQRHQKGCVYEDELFARRVQKALTTRDPKKPFFVFWAPHIVHQPYQLPREALRPFKFIRNKGRRFYHAMVHWVDAKIGEVVATLKATGAWENTLIISHADNGGPIWTTNAGNNYPLRGGKRSNWEGGIRVNAFVSGGLVPPQARGTRREGLMAAWDWYATIAALANVDTVDQRAAAAGLPPVESLNMWPFISGEAQSSPRTELAIGDTESTNPHILSATRVGGLIQGRYKLLLGELSMSGWTGPRYPNASSSKWRPEDTWQTCGSDEQSGCLYDILADPTEHHSLAREQPERFRSMLARLSELQRGVFSPDRGTVDPRACHHALHDYHGFWGPWVDLDSNPVQHTAQPGYSNIFV